MMYRLIAGQVASGAISFTKIPNRIKPAVARYLIEECNLPELVPVKYGGTARSSLRTDITSSALATGIMSKDELRQALIGEDIRQPTAHAMYNCPNCGAPIAGSVCEYCDTHIEHKNRVSTMKDGS